MRFEIGGIGRSSQGLLALPDYLCQTLSGMLFRFFHQLALTSQTRGLPQANWVRLRPWTADSGLRLYPSLLWLKNETEPDAPAHTGFGIDPDARMAELKAFAEALESLTLRRTRSSAGSRTGMAAHGTVAAARTTATLELLERDAFLFHWMTGRPGESVPAPGRWKSVALQARAKEVSVVLVGRRSDHGCWLLGMGASRNRETASQKALLEAEAAAWRHDWLGGCGPIRPGDEQAQHHRHSTETPVSARIQEILNGGSSSVDRRADRSLEDWEASVTTQVLARYERRGRGELVVVRCSSAELMPLEFGMSFSAAYTNYRAQLLSEDPGLTLLPQLPHPFD